MGQFAYYVIYLYDSTKDHVDSCLLLFPFWAVDLKGTHSCRTQGESVRLYVRPSKGLRLCRVGPGLDSRRLEPDSDMAGPDSDRPGPGSVRPGPGSVRPRPGSVRPGLCEAWAWAL